MADASRNYTRGTGEAVAWSLYRLQLMLCWWLEVSRGDTAVMLVKVGMEVMAWFYQGIKRPNLDLLTQINGWLGGLSFSKISRLTPSSRRMVLTRSRKGRLMGAPSARGAGTMSRSLRDATGQA